MAFAAEKPLFGKGMFSIDPNSTPAQLAARRELMAMLQPKYGSAKYVGEGLGQLATGIVSGLQNKRMRGIEGENTSRASSIFAGLLGGAGASEIAGQQPMNILGANPNYGDPNDPEQIGANAMSAIGRGGYRDSLIGTESGGNFAAQNNEVGAGGARGHFGRVQFGHARLQDAMNAGVIPQGTTPEQFMASPEMQKATEDWHFADLEQQLSPLVGSVVNGKPLDMGALVAMGHLGGAGGARKFVETGGGYNPSDSFGTSLADYAAKHGGQGGPTQNPATPQIPPDQLIAALSNPWLSQEQRGMLQQVLDQQVAAGDPMKALELEKAQLELAQLKNPQGAPGFQPMSAQEVAELGLPPGVYQRGPDGRIDTVEKTQATVDPIADLKARAMAAGLTEGTPEYQQFMMANGKTDGGMIIESDGQGGFRMAQGAAAGAAGSKPFTEGQSKDIVYSTRAKGALAALDPIAGALTDRTDVAAGWVPFGLGGGAQSDDYQVAKTAGDEFLQAVLRKDTGAAITPAEQQLYGETYLPRPGDSAERLKYKSEARQRAVDAIDAGMSPAQIVAQERALEKGKPPVPEFDDDAAFLKSLGLE